MDISIADVASSVTAGLILVAIKASLGNRKEIVGSLERLGLHVAENNGRIGKVEISIQAHTKEDGIRFDGIQRENDAMWRELGRRKGETT